MSIQELSVDEHRLWAEKFHDAEHDLHQRDSLLHQLTEWTESKLQLLGEILICMCGCICVHVTCASLDCVTLTMQVQLVSRTGYRIMLARPYTPSTRLG